MNAGRSARGVVATARSALAEALANRASLASQVSVMVVNDVVWVLFWALFFQRVGELRGWDVDSVLVLFAVFTAGAGGALGFFSNCRRVGRMALDGELDAVLSLPVPPLAYVLLRRVEPINMGDVLFGLALFAVAGDPTPTRVLVYLGVVIAVMVLVTGFLVLVGSLAFFARSNEGGELGFHVLLLTAGYPVDIFAGFTRVVLFTVVPAAFVSSVPARLIEDFDVGYAVWLAGLAAGFAVAAWATFTVGLRRYTSGAVWTRA